VGNGFQGLIKPVVTAVAEEPGQLRRDVAQLREEVEMLKKPQRFPRRTSYPGDKVRLYRRRTLSLQHREDSLGVKSDFWTLSVDNDCTA